MPWVACRSTTELQALTAGRMRSMYLAIGLQAAFPPQSRRLHVATLRVTTALL